MDDDFKKVLTDHDLVDPLVWAGITPPGSTEDERRSKVEDFLQALQLADPAGEPQAYTDRLDAAVALVVAARSPASTWAHQMATATDLQVNLDRALADQSRERRAVEENLGKLKDTKVQELPGVWRGKRYRRAELTGDAKAQQRLDDTERAKWGKRALQLVLEADLPLGKELKQRGLGPDSPEATRGLRGLRWPTLKKRVSDWEPARRYFLAHTGSPFPTSPAPLLQLFELRRTEGAAKSSYDSTLASLRFLEQAGEVAQGDWLHTHPSLLSAAKEATASTARGQAAASSSAQGKKQAPPLPLAALDALERVVEDEALPAFHRAYAWYRLFRHWASLRFGDTTFLNPSTLERRTSCLLYTSDAADE